MNEPLHVPAVVVAGAISHGLLALAHYHPAHHPSLSRHVTRRALQGGVALGAGALAWNSFSRGNVVTGIATILLTAGVLRQTTENSPEGVSDRQPIPLTARSE